VLMFVPSVSRPAQREEGVEAWRGFSALPLTPDAYPPCPLPLSLSPGAPSSTILLPAPQMPKEIFPASQPRPESLPPDGDVPACSKSRTEPH
jgi:hypothetical protein